MMMIRRSTALFFFLTICLSLSAYQPLPSATTVNAPPLSAQAVREPLVQSSTATTQPTPSLTPQPSPTPTLEPTQMAKAKQCYQPHGQVLRYKISFTKDAKPFLFRVYRPPCYDDSGARRYPVLYILHGQSFREDQWDRMGLDETADKMILAGQLPPLLIVMPLEPNTYADLNDTHFGTDLTDFLVPWMDSAYPTCTRRLCRAIGGLSRGGAWALRMGFKRADLFGTIGLHSTPPFIGDPNRLSEWLKKIPTDEVPTVYMDIGRYDPYMFSNVQLENLLVKYNVAHEWYLFNGMHDEAYWTSHLADYLAFYGRNWPVAP